MDFESAKEEVVARWEDILRQITSPAKQKVNGKISYVCPLCDHGKGGDGMTFNPKSKDGKGLKCFGCGFSGDIIDLVGAVDHIEDYPAQLKQAAAYIGIDVQDNVQIVAQNQPKSKQGTDMSIHTNTYTQTDTEQKASLIPYYRECQSRLEEIDYYWKRGISKALAKKYWLGYEPHFDKGTGGAVWKALIIPTSEYSYIARNLDPQAGEKDRYRKVGSVKIFNYKALQTAAAPIFVTEGEIDALSIMEVGGVAVGLGSVSNVDTFVNDYVSKQKPVQPLIIALDNDEKGEEATGKLENRLKELGVSYYPLDPYNGHKDANEALLADGKAFKEAVERAAALAESMEAKALDAEREEYYKTSSYSHLQEFINGIAESVNTQAQPTGFTKLDKILGGGLYEGLYIIGAISSLGKTTLALQMADQIADSGSDVLIFSLEMARAELISKSISRQTLLDVLDNDGDTKNAKTARGITAGARYEHYSQTERELIQRAIEAYSGYAKHIFIHEGIGDIGIERVKEVVQQHIAITGNKPVVFIDYLQILAPYDRRSTDKQNTDKAVLELKRLSRDYKIPVIGISSFNRESYKENSANKGRVTQADFKESGAIEYSADVLIGLEFTAAGSKDYSEKDEKRKDPRSIRLVTIKNRNGRAWETVDFNYYPRFNYFKES